MKKLIIIILIMSLSLACNANHFDRIIVYNAEIEKTDAEELYSFLQRTIEKNTSPLKLEEHLIGGYNTDVLVYYGKEEVRYSFLLDTLYVTSRDGIKEEYRIDRDYYESTFYPYISILMDKYAPSLYQLSNGVGAFTGERNHYSLTVEKSGAEKIRVDPIEWDRFYGFCLHIASLYHLAEEDGDKHDNLRYKLIIDDGVVKEEICVFDHYALINGRKIELRESTDIDELFSWCFD